MSRFQMFGRFKKLRYFMPPIKEKKNKKQLPLFRCIRCPFNKHQDKIIFEDDRENHETEFHEVEPVVGQTFTETEEFFDGVEQDADERGELHF